MANSTKAPGTVSSASGTGSVGWTNPNNAKTVDGLYATCSLANGQQSFRLRCSNLGFAIPTNSTINGIVITPTWHASAVDKIESWEIYTMKSASEVGGPVGFGDHLPSGSDSSPGYGGSTYLWGTTWTPADINASGFGASVKVGSLSAGTATASIEIVQVTVYYTLYWALAYNGNGNTGGSTPNNGNYDDGSTPTVSGAGTLVKSGYRFNGWNTAANGSGTSYAAGSSLAAMHADVTLYAQWVAVYTVTYDGNGNTSGAVPTDSSSPYDSGATVTVLSKNTLTKTDYTFNGWNTAANGSGTSYSVGATFSMPASNTTLYAKWVKLPYPRTIKMQLM